MTKKSWHNQANVIMRTIKYVSVAQDSELVCAVLQQAPDGVTRAVLNAALNASQRDVHIYPNLKAAFYKHYRKFDILTDKQEPLQNKRRILVKRSGFKLIIAPLIAIVLGLIGS